jgi:hypothetical protein
MREFHFQLLLPSIASHGSHEECSDNSVTKGTSTGIAPLEHAPLPSDQQLPLFVTCGNFIPSRAHAVETDEAAVVALGQLAQERRKAHGVGHYAVREELRGETDRVDTHPAPAAAARPAA